MHRSLRFHGPLAAFAAVFLALACSSAFADPKTETPPFPWEGEVTGTNVFVRSGAGNNWYPTAKLSAGDRVLVMGEKIGWYQIAPPAGSFSYIDQSMVERKAGAKTGTVKQDKTYVRAGSKLEGRKNSMQVVLSKGATVEIIGESDGFYQIKPPNGATLFMSKQYVKPVESTLRTGLLEKHVSNPEPVAPAADAPSTGAPSPGSDPKAPASNTGEPGRIQIPADKTEPPAATVAPAGRALSASDGLSSPSSPPNSGTTGDAMNPIESPPTDGNEQPMDNQPAKSGKAKSTKPIARRSEPAPPAPPATGRYKAMLTLLESELADMGRRPFDQQDYTSLVARYEPIANQAEEKVPSQIAKIRLKQLNDRSELKLARTDIEKDEKQLADLHANMDKERVKIMNRRVEAAMVRYDLEGELRESFAFAPENRRYRLVDPITKVTLAYVDIPTSVEGNPTHLIGQVVGVKTSGKKFSPSARVPIAVAAELIDLSPRKALGDAAMRHAAVPSDPIAKDGTAAKHDALLKDEADASKHAAAPVHENLPPPLDDKKTGAKHDENSIKIQPPKEQPAEEPNSDSAESTSDAGDKAEP